MKINIKDPVKKYKYEMDEKISALSARINIALVDKDPQLVDKLKKEKEALMEEKLENLPKIKAEYRESKKAKKKA